MAEVNQHVTRKPAADQALKATIVFLAAACAWLLLSFAVPLAAVISRRQLYLEQFLFDAAFISAAAYFLHRTVHRHLTKNAVAMRLLKEHLRAFHLVADCDFAVQRAQSREELFDEVCRLAVERGGYRMVWVGLARDDAEKNVQPVARAGYDPGYVDEAKIVWSDSPRGQGPTGVCIRTGAASVCRFTEDDRRLLPWREKALSAGYLSTMALPLKQGDRAVGAMTIYSDRPDAFDETEAALLDRLARTISYALEHLETLRSERGLLEKLKVLGQAVEGSPMSIVVTDARGDIELVNRKFTETTGYSAAEVLGKNPRLLKTGDTSPDEYRRLWETISRGEDWKGVLHNRRKNGETFWELAVISPVRDEDGAVRHYIAVKEDITEKRSLEDQLRQAQKMESLGALAGGVAHDFNNLLTIIEGHCELLAASRLTADGDRESVAEIRTAAERAAAMTKRLLMFGRKQPMRARRLDLSQTVWESVRLLKRLAGENYAVEVDRPGEPLFARADAAMIEQILMNLAVNARDAMPRGGKIAIALAPAPDGAAPPPGVPPAPNGFLRLTVSDQGCGIPAGDLPRVFEPFFTTKPVGKGTGLGLSVVDGIVRQHKGWAEAESAVGKGSVFSVYLPREAAVPGEAPAPAPAAPVGGTESVLLVEDDAPLRAVAARVLRGAGYAVTEAASGPDALAAWEKRTAPFRLLVSDMVMPGGMTGVELGRRLRADDAGLRVIVTSGYHPELPLDSAEIGEGFRFMAKPFKPEDLARAVRAELDRA